MFNSARRIIPHRFLLRHPILILIVLGGCLWPSSGVSRLSSAANSRQTQFPETPLVISAEDKNRHVIETSNLFGATRFFDINQSQDYLFTDQFGCFLRPSSTGTIVRVYQVGEAIPGISGSRSDLITSIRLNNAGTAVLTVDYPNPDGFFQRAILKYEAGSLQRILNSTDTAPSSAGAPYGRSFLLAGENDSGDVALLAPLVASNSTAPVQNTIFVISNGGTAARVAGPGDVAPGTGGGTLANISLPAGVNSFTNGGEVLFSAQITGGSGGFGLFAGSAGSVRKIITNGDPNPLGGNFTVTTAISTVRINNSGQVAFSLANAIWTHATGPGITKVAALNDAAPAATGGTYSQAPALSDFNDSGNVAFITNVAGSALTSRAVFRYLPGNPIEVVAYSNQSAPGAGSAIINNFSAISMSNTGTVSFIAALSGGSVARGIFQQSTGNPSKIVLEGDNSPLSGGGQFHFAGTGVTRSLNSGAVYFSCNITGSATTSADFVGPAGSFTKLVSDGDALPAGSRTVLRTFRVGAAGDYVGFLARQAGGRASLMTKNVSTLITTTIFTDGDVGPGTGGARLRNTSLNTLYVNSSGAIAFPALVIGGTPVLANSIWTGTTGALTKVVMDGDLEPSSGFPFSQISINQIIPNPLNDSGQVVFRATVQNRQGIYTTVLVGPIIRIVQANDAAPGGGAFQSFSQVQSINASAQIAFFATTTGGPGQNQGIFIGQPGGPVTKVAVSGDTAPGGGTFFSFPNVASLNDSGEVAFIATLAPAGATGGVFAGAVGSLQALALHGAATPAGGTYSITGSSLDIQINNQHDVVFRSLITGSSSDSAYFMRRGAAGALRTVIAQADPAPGTSGSFATLQGSVNNLLGEFVGLGPTGEVGIQTTVQTPSGNVFGGFRFRTDNLLEKSALRGEPLPGIPGAVLGAASQGLGVGGPGHFSIWAELIGGTNDDVIYTTNSPNGFGISGQVKDVNGTGIPGISVEITGPVNGAVTTDASGNFSFANLINGGNYVVAPADDHFSFSPTSQTINNLDSNRILNFVGTQTKVSISGTITDTNGAPQNNVTVSINENGVPAGTTTSNAQGNYSLTNLSASGNFVVTPQGSFAPSTQTFNGLAANAIANFKGTPSIPPQCNTVTFAKTDFSTDTGAFGAFAVVTADFNGDGKIDLAATNFTAGTVSVLLGAGNGSFGAATNFPVGQGAYSLAVGDFNNDGKPDLVTVNNDTDNFSILLGTGTGSFAPATSFPGMSRPRSVAVGDVNGDNNADLAIANFNGNNIAILLGNGAGGFGPPTTFPTGTNATSVTLADLNNDGKLDAAVANFGPDNVSILLGNGSGGFAPATNFAVDTDPFFIRTGDFNNDGKVDLAVANVNGNDVSILLGTGTGNFGAATNFPMGTAPTSVVIGDFNGDGQSDIAASNNTSPGSVSIRLGTGTGSFGAVSSFATGLGSRPLAKGEFNGDGKIDLAIPNQSSNNISVLLNNGATCNTLSSLSISGHVSSAANQPLPDVTVTLSGPITRVTQSDTSGNYSFPNLAPGGNYTVTVQSNYYVSAPSRADFLNLSSDQTANFIAAPLAVPSPTPTPNDDFTSSTRDASKWSIGAQTSSTTAFDPQVTTAQVNGQLVITPLTQASGLHFAGYVSANSFDLRNGSVRVEVVKAATGGADTIFAIGTDVDNFYRFMVHTPGTGTTLAPTARGRDGIVRPLDTTVAQLVFQVNVNGQLTSLSIPYDPVLHRFMRFRHEPVTNSIIFETSPDNIAFTKQNTVVLQKSVSALTAELSAGTTNPTNPGSAIFDNYNLVTSTFQFSAAAYSISEGDGSFLVTVTRSGSLTDAATVDFATADGTARQKTRYISAAGTLTFTAGVASRTFRVLLVDNQVTEGEQSLNLLLSNPTGAGLNTPGRAVLTISDNDTALATGNPLDDARYFVTQHYYDFLSRVPDQGGLDFWTGQITLCGTDVNCLRTQRITVSNAFFYEQEYQQTGSYVVRLYRAAYGNNQPIPNTDANPLFPNENKKLVNYSAFSPDRARVRGGPSLAQTQLDLANAFVLRPQFVAKYPSSLDAPGFVDAVLATINNDLGVDLSSQRAALLTLYGQGGRGAVMYRLADDNTVTNPINNRALIDAEYNRAFVLTQYFGYLRRNPDIGGYIFWLGQVNSAPLRALEKQRAMVCSFITSLEYQQRFSPVATHNNTECQ